MNIYIAISATLGAVRKALIVKDAKISSYDYNKHDYVETPMLTSDKIMCTIIGGMCGTVWGPVWLWNIIQKAEVASKGYDPKLYFPVIEHKHKSVFDYMMA